MSIDDNFTYSEKTQSAESNLQQGATGHSHQRLGAGIGERTQACAQSSGQDHRLHRPIFSNSMCRTTASTPLSRRCFANFSARYTERCWPPVHPNETIRFLKLRR